MPKQSGLETKAEAAIGERLKRFREHIKWSQRAFAFELGITRDKVASIEYGRTPIRYDLARTICERFDLSQAWLATGRGGTHPRIPIAKEIEAQIPDGMLLSQAFTGFIKGNYDQEHYQVSRLVGQFNSTATVFLNPPSLKPDKTRRWILVKYLTEQAKAVPVELQEEFSETVRAAMCKFVFKHGLKLRRVMLADSDKAQATANTRGESVDSSKGGKQDLTETAISAKSSDVKTKDLWPALKKELQRVTAETSGAKTALADFLEVELSRVSQWLSDSPKTAREPGAEYALLMQAWLKNPKRQGK